MSWLIYIAVGGKSVLPPTDTYELLRCKATFAILETRVLQGGFQMKNIFHKIKKKIQEKQNKQISERTQKVCNFLNRYSLIFHYLLSCAICFVIECASRHSLLAGFEFIGHQPLVYLYNAMIVFITFLPVYLLRRRALARILIGSIWTCMWSIDGCFLWYLITPVGFTYL